MTYHEEARTAFRRGETAVVERLSRRELDRARHASDAGAEVDALCMLARVRLRNGNPAEAGRWTTQARKVARRAGEKGFELTPAHLLAGLASVSGDLERPGQGVSEDVRA